MFSGFHPDIFTFLNQLYLNNSPQWFEAHKKFYIREIKPLAKMIVQQLAPVVHYLDPNREITPAINKTISRLRRDVRFHPERRPFRRYVYITFPKQGFRWAEGALLFLAVEHRGVWVGFWSGGLPCRKEMQNWKTNLREGPALFQEYLTRFRLVERYFELEGDAEGPLVERLLPGNPENWLNKKEIRVGCFYPKENDLLYGNEFLHMVISHFLDLYPFCLFFEHVPVTGHWKAYLEKRAQFHWIL